MNTVTVSFFGHRDFDGHFECEERLNEIIEDLINNNEYTEFLVGRNGEFDIFSASAVVHARKKRDDLCCSLILILPYITAEVKRSEDYFYDYYDNIEICRKAEKAHFKEVFKIRNREMIDRSDIVICYVEREKGGAYFSMKYAIKTGKKVINLAENTPS